MIHSQQQYSGMWLLLLTDEEEFYVCQEVPLPKISLSILVIAYTEIYPITCKHSSSGEQAELERVSLFVDQHEFIHRST